MSLLAMCCRKPLLAVQNSAREQPQGNSNVCSVSLFLDILFQSLQQYPECCTIAAGKADFKATSGTMPKASSRPGTAKNGRSGTIRPGPTSAALGQMMANDGLCLQISNKKDERAKKVHRGCMPFLYCILTLPHCLPPPPPSPPPPPPPHTHTMPT